jgi:hypothetical protein
LVLTAIVARALIRKGPAAGIAKNDVLQESLHP